MRNYVIINGVNSLTINGLAIKELPPISKPLMRATLETIDGRDGDITTYLGYSAYDKEMEIGLFGNYDINNIIAFFNQEGTTELFDLINPLLKRVQTMLLLSKNNVTPARDFMGETQPNNEDIDASSYARTMTLDTYYSLKTLNSQISKK